MSLSIKIIQDSLSQKITKGDSLSLINSNFPFKDFFVINPIKNASSLFPLHFKLNPHSAKAGFVKLLNLEILQIWFVSYLFGDNKFERKKEPQTFAIELTTIFVAKSLAFL